MSEGNRPCSSQGQALALLDLLLSVETMTEALLLLGADGRVEDFEPDMRRLYDRMVTTTARLRMLLGPPAEPPQC